MNTNPPTWDRHAPSIPFVDRVMQPQMYRWNVDKVVWEVRPPQFQSAMKIETVSNTMSGAAFGLLATDGYTYRTNLDSMVKIMQASSIINDQIPVLTWEFYKQGQVYLTRVVL